MSALDGIRERAAVVTSSEVFDLTSAFIQVAKSQEDLPRLLAAIEGVLERHQDTEAYDLHDEMVLVCDECYGDDGNPALYPCPTVKAITVALEARP